jgi:hypothetical protein
MATSGRAGPHVGLGVFSLALGAAPLVAPRAVARGAGLSTRPRVRGVLRAVGVRELVVGTGLLVRRAPVWLWARVAQDAMDVPLASVTTATKNGADRARMARVTAFLAAVTVVDVAAAVQATRAHQRAMEREKGSADAYRAAVTIRRDEAEIRSRLPQADPPLNDDRTTVTFKAAPGARGVEVRAVLEQKTPGGPLGKAAGAVTGTDPGRQLTDAMRRFKQLLETGEVIRSEGSPDGVDAARQRKQRSAQPVAASA